ncbi:MAG TPA: hypothetical protein VGN97_18360 [Mesorhizobium sp.]|nr:hypothetical protein [Mesorhizobium sp.]
MSTRADNFLNELQNAGAAIAAGASLLPVCLADDEAADDVAAGIMAAGYEAVTLNGHLYARLAPGDAVAVFTPAPPTPARVINVRTIGDRIGVVKTAALMDAIDELATSGMTIGGAVFPPRVFVLIRSMLENLGTFEQPGGLDISRGEAQQFLQLFVAHGILTGADAEALTNG